MKGRKEGLTQGRKVGSQGRKEERKEVKGGRNEGNQE